ncbi:MAG: alanine racemase [Patescibacteria group bacterium]
MNTYIELNKKNIVHNYLAFKINIPAKTKIICVVKANAYGYGLMEITTILDKVADMYAVDNVDELEIVRDISSKPVLIFQQLSSDEIKRALKIGCEFSVGSKEYLILLDKIAKDAKSQPKVHIEIDAKFGRTGFSSKKLGGVSINKYSNVIIDSVYSHYSCSTDSSLSKFNIIQEKILRKAISTFKKKGVNLKCHISSTSSALIHGIQKDDYVRIGAGLYGIYPSEYVEKHSKVKNLLPIMRWITRISHIKELPKNHPVGYGQTYKTKKITKIAVLPVGYGFGYNRHLSNRGSVLIHKTLCPILGLISMTTITVDVSKIKNVKIGDEVVLVGNQGNKIISVTQVANMIGGIHAEISTSISPLIKRVIV